MPLRLLNREGEAPAEPLSEMGSAGASPSRILPSAEIAALATGRKWAQQELRPPVLRRLRFSRIDPAKRSRSRDRSDINLRHGLTVDPIKVEP